MGDESHEIDILICYCLLHIKNQLNHGKGY